jgi:hypothetical protein
MVAPASNAFSPTIPLKSAERCASAPSRSPINAAVAESGRDAVVLPGRR